MKFPKTELKACCFIKKKGKVFLVRYPTNEGKLGPWCLPCSRAKQGENIGKNVERKILEETGLLVKTIAPKLFVKPKAEYPVDGIDHRSYKGKLTFTLVSEAVIISGKPAMRKKGAQYKWAKLKDAEKEDLSAEVKEAVNFFLDKKRSKPFSPITI